MITIAMVILSKNDTKGRYYLRIETFKVKIILFKNYSIWFNKEKSKYFREIIIARKRGKMKIKSRLTLKTVSQCYSVSRALKAQALKGHYCKVLLFNNLHNDDSQ